MQNNTAFSLLISLIRSKTKCTKDLQKGLMIRDLMALDKTLTVGDVARRVQLSLPWVVIRKSLADAYVCGDPLLREAIGSGRIPTASAFYEFQLLEDDTQARLLKSDLPELSSRICRQAKTLQGSPMSDADFIMCLSERGPGEDLTTKNVPYLASVSDVAIKDKSAATGRKPSLASYNKHPVEHYQTHDETISLALPKKRRDEMLFGFDASVIQRFLRNSGQPVPNGCLEVTRVFVAVVKQIAAASRPAQ